MKYAELVQPFIVPPGAKVSLKDYDPKFTGEFACKGDADGMLKKSVKQLAKNQDMLYAQDQYALLIIFQAMDAAGKDGAIKHVMSGLNPQGTQVYSFKQPSSEELDHDYLWRNFKALPERGRIGIFNRSYYEEALVVRVHPQILAGEHLPPELKEGDDVWKRRFREINAFERYLVDNGIIVLKFYLNVSKEEQKARFLARIDQPEKNWKFSAADAKERAYWDDYMQAYEDVFNHTSTDWAPWHIIPADNKWYTRLTVARIIYRTMQKLNLAYPELNEQQMQALQEAKQVLEQEE